MAPSVHRMVTYRQSSRIGVGRLKKKLTHIWSRACGGRVSLDSESLENQPQRALVLVEGFRLMSLLCLRADDQRRNVASTVGRITGFRLIEDDDKQTVLLKS